MSPDGTGQLPFPGSNQTAPPIGSVLSPEHSRGNHNSVVGVPISDEGPHVSIVIAFSRGGSRARLDRRIPLDYPVVAGGSGLSTRQNPAE